MEFNFFSLFAFHISSANHFLYKFYLGAVNVCVYIAVGEIEQVTTALDTEVSFRLELLSYLMVTCDFSITFPLKITFTLC